MQSSQVIITSNAPLPAAHREAIEAEGSEVIEIDRASQLIARIERLSESAGLSDTESRIFEGVVMDDSNVKLAKRYDMSANQVSNAIRAIVGKLNDAMPAEAPRPTITGRDALVWHSHAFYLQ